MVQRAALPLNFATHLLKLPAAIEGRGLDGTVKENQLLGFDLLSCSQYRCVICSFEHLQGVKTRCATWPAPFHENKWIPEKPR